ncbi:deleted in malignant brain tumors 1 protein-like, partial [Protopterus annectens]|uniref:deleted in malignant brain tumors 1 protein-like n=1 Tax=Protopterus annectens TaxID=7888 RepID=UPI001CFB7AD5
MGSAPQILVTTLLVFASVHLYTSENIRIRLKGDYYSCSGEVEVDSDGRWKSLCSTNLTINDAKVACRQLSCGVPVTMYTIAYTGQDYRDILVSNLQCNGSEPSLSYCSINAPTAQKCTQDQTVGLTCLGTFYTWLANGPNNCAGDVFINSYTIYGYMSATEWDINDANVVCRQAGCGFALSTASSSQPAGFYNVRLENAGCSGTEDNLQSCPGLTLTTNLSSNSSIARVICSKNNLKLRLVNGTTDCSGRVEVHNGLSWVSVCGTNWGMNEAKAVCAQLHCGFPLQVNSNSYFGQGSGDVFHEMVMCSGNEISLFTCDLSQPRPSDCTHANDASVICSGLRLTNGTDRCNGIVEVNNGSQWGGVCGNSWTYSKASVICQDLRCGYALSVQRDNLSGENQEPIFLESIQCNGWEESLSQCSNSQLGNVLCNTSQVAAVQCSGDDLGVFELRLMNGSNQCSGRVDVYAQNYNTWGTVLGSHWDIYDAMVVCRYFECGLAIAAYNNSEYGSGSGPVWFDANCYGNETSLPQCPLTLLGPPDTNSHANDAAIMCTGPISVAFSNDTMCSGTVLMSYNNTQGYISAEGWDIRDANVVCQSQGCGFALEISTVKRVDSTPVWVKDLQCNGLEPSLIYCPGATLITDTDISPYIAAVTCAKGGLAVRLTNGTNRCNGILEVNISSGWKHVCANSQSLSFASVVCGELLCGQALSIESNISYGGNIDWIALSAITCSGYESSLSSCKNYPWEKSTCNSSQDVTIVCSGRQTVKYALISGNCSGNVVFAFAEDYSYYMSYQTFPVVAWDIRDANVVCRLSHCGFAIAASTYVQYGYRSAVLDLRCNGNESSFYNCPQSVIDPDRNPYAIYPAVNCTGYWTTRITNGTSHFSGRVEIFYRNTWIPVSTEGWDINDANVVCRSQGYGFALAAVTDSSFGMVSASTWFRNFQCTGTEYALSDCSGEVSTNVNNSSAVAGVICSTGELIVRLVNGTNHCNGILEVNRYSSWERACSNSWNIQLAKAVCSELYCNGPSSIGSSIDNKESQDGVWLSNTYCYGHESSLSQCRSDPWSNVFCNSSQQIQIKCLGPAAITSVSLSVQENPCSGKVQFYLANLYSYYYISIENGPVVDWDLKDANAVCRQSGCGLAVAAPSSSEYGRKSALLSIQCIGNEYSLSACSLSIIASNGTKYEKYPAVKCSGHFVVKLVNATFCSGTVVISYNNTQGYISSEGWDIRDANVVCQSLMCGSAIKAITVKRADSTPIWFKDFQCNGTEPSLHYCPATAIATYINFPSYIAAVTCAKGHFVVKLVNATFCSGTVVISYNNTQGYISSEGWDIRDANVVCQSLMCGSAI